MELLAYIRGSLFKSRSWLGWGVLLALAVLTMPPLSHAGVMAGGVAPIAGTGASIAWSATALPELAAAGTSGLRVASTSPTPVTLSRPDGTQSTIGHITYILAAGQTMGSGDFGNLLAVSAIGNLLNPPMIMRMYAGQFSAVFVGTAGIPVITLASFPISSDLQGGDFGPTESQRTAAVGDIAAAFSAPSSAGALGTLVASVVNGTTTLVVDAVSPPAVPPASLSCSIT